VQPFDFINLAAEHTGDVDPLPDDLLTRKDFKISSIIDRMITIEGIEGF
jgi:hypothetical protein